MDRQTAVGLIITLVILLGVLELVRRRRLREEYSLLWIITAAALTVLNLWDDPLDWLARLTGIYRPTVLLVVAVGFFLLIMLYYSTVLTRLADQNKALAQEVALLRERLERLGIPASTDDDPPAA
ncbi:MAG: DUF2304 domain-containing protein [Anaerolineae bacterium]|nr:DUF2304 domain-containing protein [Anaerolineae bacterium]